MVQSSTKNEKEIDLPDLQGEDSAESELNNEPLNIQSLINLIPRCSYQLSNTFICYFLSYTINTSFANVIDYKMKLKYKDDFFIEHHFMLLLLSGSTGLLISRSSLGII